MPCFVPPLLLGCSLVFCFLSIYCTTYFVVMDSLNFTGFWSCPPLPLSQTALSLVPEQAQLSHWLSPVLVLPVLQLLSCSSLTEALADRRTHRLNQDLAHSLLRRIGRETHKPRQVSYPHGRIHMKRFQQYQCWPYTLN